MKDEGRLPNGWKITAIIFIILFLTETLFFVWAYYQGAEEQEKILECYYNVCERYPEAFYEETVCTCYEFDVIGNLVVAKTELLK